MVTVILSWCVCYQSNFGRSLLCSVSFPSDSFLSLSLPDLSVSLFLFLFLPLALSSLLSRDAEELVPLLLSHCEGAKESLAVSAFQ